MATKSQISWTDATWNVAIGCKKVDKDCLYCYMYRQSLNGTRYEPDQVTQTKKTGVFSFPLKYKETKSAVWEGNPLIFTSSLTDFFIEDIDGFRDEAWDIIRKSPHLTFQILTKRPERIHDHLPSDWGDGWDNVWLGTSIGSQLSIHRAGKMFNFPAKTRFLSLEPMFGEIDLMYPEEFFPGGPPRCCSGRECGCMGQPTEPPILHGFNWVIIGGESGNDNGKYRYRPAEISWFENLVSDCKSLHIPVFVKQLGTHLSKHFGLSDRAGADHDEWPEELDHIKLKQFPKWKQ